MIYFTGGNIPESRRFKESTINNMTSMTLSKVTRTDAGEYSTTLTNTFGSVTFSLKLNVIGKA